MGLFNHMFFNYYCQPVSNLQDNNHYIDLRNVYLVITIKVLLLSNRFADICRPSQRVTYTVGFSQRNMEENRQNPNTKMCMVLEILYM